jgi:DNA (cytosine-5)-methyltransferase 1
MSRMSGASHGLLTLIARLFNMTAYYNEFNPHAAHMLRQLIRDGLIAPGDVDERPIQEVTADDLRKYTQCHFFAGIGGWSVALRMAGCDDSRSVWTGSCPCQPFSSAGKQKGKEDERHLWPVWFRLIRESKPPIVFGEQVSAAIRHGWWDDVADDLEGEGYTTRAEIRPASGVGRPHKRDRLWFVGYAEHDGQSAGQVAGSEGQAIQHNTQGTDSASELTGAGAAEHVADAELRGCECEQEQQRSRIQRPMDGKAESWEPTGSHRTSDVADSERFGQQRQGALGKPVHTEAGDERQASESFDDSAGVQWLLCPDGKSRPVKHGVRLLVDGLQHRAPILHAFGNAIVPACAAAFIKDNG